MSGRTKAERLEELKRLYIQRAYTDMELAEKLGVSRETIFRDRKDLMLDYPVEQDDEGRWHIPKTKLISEIKLNLHEALTLYLAGRKTSRQTKFHQPHTVDAEEKLAATLRQPITERLLKPAEKLTTQEKNPEKIKIIEVITQAWVEQRKVRIEYQALGSDGLTRHNISPYIIEPSIWSDSVYVIAQSDFNDQIFAFKMDRILSSGGGVDVSGAAASGLEVPASFAGGGTETGSSPHAAMAATAEVNATTSESERRCMRGGEQTRGHLAPPRDSLHFSSAPALGGEPGQVHGKAVVQAERAPSVSVLATHRPSHIVRGS